VSSVWTGAAIALAGRFDKDNAAARESIARVSGSGVYARGSRYQSHRPKLSRLQRFNADSHLHAQSHNPKTPGTGFGTDAIPSATLLQPLSEAEQASFFPCEEVIRMGWSSFVDAGMALAQIRNARLYRDDYDSFEDYCRDKWQYGRNYVDGMISAAQLFTHLMTNCHCQKPQHESQLRPLIGLTAEQAQAAWENAVDQAGKKNITAAPVKKAVRELQAAGAADLVAPPKRPGKAERRRILGEEARRRFLG
jgi:hypothetical protein